MGEKRRDVWWMSIPDWNVQVSARMRGTHEEGFDV